MADHRPDAYEREDGVMVFRASSFGRCDRAIIAAGQGVDGAPPPASMQVKFDEGVAAEPELLMCLAERPSRGREIKWRDGESLVNIGLNTLLPEIATSYRKMGAGIMREPHDGQFTMELPLAKDIVLYGHLDGAGSVYVTGDDRFEPGQMVVVEAKAFGDAYWKQWIKEGIAGFPMYDWQTDAYALAANAGVLIIVGHKGIDGKVFEIRCEWKPKPNRGLGHFKIRGMKLAKAIYSGVLPADCGEAGEQYLCPMFFLHSDYKEEEKRRLETYKDEEAIRLANSIARHTEIANIHLASVKTGKEALKKLWDEQYGQDVVGVYADMTIRRKQYTVEPHMVGESLRDYIEVKVAKKKPKKEAVKQEEES